MSTLAPVLRPMGLGELLDRALTFWRAHWKALFQLVLGFQLVTYVFVAAAQGLGKKWFPLASDPTALQKTPDLAFPHLLGANGLLMSAGLIALFLSQLSAVAITWYAWSRITARGTPSPGDAFRHAAARLTSSAGVFGLSLAWSLGVFALLMIPAGVFGGLSAFLITRDSGGAALAAGIVGGLLLFAATVIVILWFVIRFILVSQIIAVESLGALATFGRSNVMSSGRVESGPIGLVKLRLTVLVTVIGALLLLMSLVNSLPLFIVGAFFGANFTPGNTVYDVVPLVVLVPLQLGQTFLGSLVSPLFAIFQTFFYADMRMRREGLDLELALGGTE